MQKSKRSKLKNNIIMIALILLASMAAILSKILLPSAVNEEDFNSIFVKAMGFPVVWAKYYAPEEQKNIMTLNHNVLKWFDNMSNPIPTWYRE